MFILKMEIFQPLGVTTAVLWRVRTRNCNCDGKRLRIYSALARTYEAGENLNAAADAHIYILNNFPSNQSTGAALTFLENNLAALEEIDGNAQKLKNLLNGTAKAE